MALIKGSARSGLTSTTLGFFCGFAAVALFGPTAGHFREALQLSPLQIGLLIAAPSLSGSLLRIPFGAWVDSNGGRKPFLILLWLSLAGMTGLAVLTSFPALLTPSVYPVLLLLAVLSGCGIATFSVGIGMTSYWFARKRQGGALATYAGLGNLAPGLFSLLLPLVLVSWGLSTAYLAWLCILLAGLLFFQFSARSAPYFQLREQGLAPDQARAQASASGQELFPQGNARESLTAAARVWQTWVLVAIYFTSFGGFIVHCPNRLVPNLLEKPVWRQ